MGSALWGAIRRVASPVLKPERGVLVVLAGKWPSRLGGRLWGFRAGLARKTPQIGFLAQIRAGSTKSCPNPTSNDPRCGLRAIHTRVIDRPPIEDASSRRDAHNGRADRASASHRGREDDGHPRMRVHLRPRCLRGCTRRLPLTARHGRAACSPRWFSSRPMYTSATRYAAFSREASLCHTMLQSSKSSSVNNCAKAATRCSCRSFLCKCAVE